MVPGTGSDARRLPFLPSALVLLGLVAVLLFTSNGATSVFDRDEARFALAVREMREHADWILPTNFGEPRYHKPILAYWMALGAERVFGPGEFAWRFPSATAGLVTVLATLLLARRHFGERVALRAAAVLGTSLIFLIETKILTADALQLATTTVAFWAWDELRSQPRRRRGWQLLFWCAVGLGVLAKGVAVFFLAAAAVAGAFLRGIRLAGPGLGARTVGLALLACSVAAALPGLGALGPLGLVLLAVFVVRRAPRTSGPRAELGARFGVPLTLALVALWLVPALVRSHGAFLSEGVGHHMLERTASPFEGHWGFPGYYLVTGVLVLFPWAAFLPAALRVSWRDPRGEFFLAWILGPWALLECMASKLPHYVLVTAPAVAILIALHWEGIAAASARARHLQTALFALPCALLAIGGVVIGKRLGGAALTGGLLLTVVAAGWGLGHLAIARRPGGPRFTWIAGGAWVLWVVVLGVLLPAYEPHRIAKPLGRELARLARPEERVFLVNYRPASVGCAAPEGHALVEDPPAVQAELEHPGPDGLFVMRADSIDARFADTRGALAPEWSVLATVEGLEGLRPKRLWILRRRDR